MAGPFGNDNRELVEAIRELTQEIIRNSPANQRALGEYAAKALGLGGNAPLPAPMFANVPPPMAGSAAALQAAGMGQYGSPIGPTLPPQWGANPNQYASPIGPQQQWSMGYSPHQMGGAEPFNIFNTFGRDLMGAMPGMLAGTANYAAAKIPYGTTGTTAELGLNSQMGMLKQLSQIAGVVPGLGAFGQRQFEGLEEAVYAPEQRARARLGPTFERMAMAGISVSDKEIDEAFRFALPMERRGLYMKQRLDRIGAAVNAENALSSALSQIGM